MKHHDQEQQAQARQAEQRLCEAFLSLQDASQVIAFLRDLCTPAELEAMVDRWRVALLLDQGHTYRDISRETGVSVTTIGRVARFIQQGNDGYRAALDQTGEQP